MRHNIYVGRLSILVVVVFACMAAQHRYPVSGLVLDIDKPHQLVVVSHGSIPGYMEAMSMPFHVRTPGLLEGLHAGDTVAFSEVIVIGAASVMP